MLQFHANTNADAMHVVPKRDKVTHTDPSSPGYSNHRFVHNHPDTNPASPPIITRERLLAIQVKFHTMGINFTRMHMHAQHQHATFNQSMNTTIIINRIKPKHDVLNDHAHNQQHKHAFHSQNPDTIKCHRYTTAYTPSMH